MRSLRRLCAVLLCLCLCFGLAGCQGQNITFEDAEPETIPPSQREVVDYTTLRYTPFDGETFLQRVDTLTALLEEDGQSEQVLAEYHALAGDLRDCLTMYQMSQILYYLDYTDAAREEAGNDAYAVANDCSDAFSTLLSDILDSGYRDDFIKEVGRSNALMYENYEALTDEQRALMEQEQELESEYTRLSGGDFETYGDMAEVMAPLYVELVDVRNRMAASFGYDDYPTYAYEQIYGRDYTPEDARKLEDIVKDGLAALYITALYYMDEEAMDAPYLDGDASEERLLSLMQQYLPQMDSLLGDTLDYMLACHAYDITYSDTKYESSFTTMLTSYTMPFLFSQPQPDSLMYSLGTLVHEFGHYFCYLNDPAYATAEGFIYSSDNIDVAEINSTSLELLFLRYYPELYGDSAELLQQNVVLDILSNVVLGCIFDEFQQTIYNTRDLQPEDISEIFHEIFLSYVGDVYIDDYAYNVWALVNHNFDAPMYYISYAVSSLASFQIWENAQDDPDAALQQYLNLTSYGTSVNFLALLDECGLKNVFDEDYLEGLLDILYDTLL